jgi:hypothetical protein
VEPRARTEPPPPDAARADRWTRVIVSLRTAQMRSAYLKQELRSLGAPSAALALEVLCARAEEGSEAAATAMHALVELLADPTLTEAREALRREARGSKLLAVERLLRRPFVARRSDDGSIPSRSNARLESRSDSRKMAALFEDDPEAAMREETRDLPDYGTGRPLSLGERKSIARRPSSDILPKVLADPHPDVIRMVLASARLTEDDVVRLCSRRPNRGEVLAEVARHPRWCHRPRVRAALVLNPHTPTELSIALVALLRRDELAIVCTSTLLHPAVRAAARERLERRPPIRRPPHGSVQ